MLFSRYRLFVIPRDSQKLILLLMLLLLFLFYLRHQGFVKIYKKCLKGRAFRCFILAVSIAPLQVHYYSEALPTQHGYCIGVSRRSATGNITERKDLPKVSTWRL